MAYHLAIRLPSEEAVHFARPQQQMDGQMGLETVSVLTGLTGQEIALPMILEDLPSA
jgi:hypothetical protein